MFAKVRDNKWFQDKFLERPYRVHVVLFLIMIAQGFIFDTPANIFRGLWDILITTDLLITDSIAVGGIGAAFVNVALAGLLAIGAMAFAKHKPSGLAIATLGVVIAMAFFGKNPINMLPIIAGGWLYSKVTGTPHANCVLPSVLATCLAPVVSRFVAVSGMDGAQSIDLIYRIPVPVGIAMGVLLGLGIGYIMTPFAAALRKTHEGYLLYNVGFAAGIMAVGMYAVFQTFGIRQYIIDNWSSGYNVELAIFSIVMSVYYIVCGLLSRARPLSLKELLFIDAEDYDHYKKYSCKTYVSMGVLGLICVAFMFVVRGDYNGVVIGGLISTIGFAAFGKPIVSSITLMGGAMLAAATRMLLTGTPINHRSFLVATLFATCLAPIATRFGWKWGLVAGFLHLSLSVQVAIFHGGMNLYNNGFAGGLAAMILVPIMKYVAEERAKKTI
jgi:hypothetical protein